MHVYKFYIFVVLDIEPKAWCLAGKHLPLTYTLYLDSVFTTLAVYFVFVLRQCLTKPPRVALAILTSCRA